MGMPTLLDIAKHTGNDAVVGLVDEASQAHPELTGTGFVAARQVTVPNVGSARTIRGINYKTLVRTAVPTVAFRNFNEGTAVAGATYENRLVETYLLNPPWECDKAIASVHEDGPAAFIAVEGAAVLEAAFQRLCSVFYYGQALDAKGFPGLVQMYHASMLSKSGGSTASVQTSVYAVRWGAQDVQWVWGLDGALDLSEVTEVRLVDTNNNPYMAYHQEIMARPGLQVMSKFSVARLANIHPTDDTLKAGLDDDKLATLIGLFPEGRPPHVLLMNKDAVAMLRNSRTATNATGAPAPFPEEAFGIPILPTGAITSTEAVVV